MKDVRGDSRVDFLLPSGDGGGMLLNSGEWGPVWISPWSGTSFLEAGEEGGCGEGTVAVLQQQLPMVKCGGSENS
jgi:hypothetical protein